MTPKGIIQLLINLAMITFLLYSYLWIAEQISYDRALLILLFFGFLGLGGMLNTIAQTIQKKNFKSVFTESELVVTVLALRTAREKEDKNWQRNEFLETETKLIKFLMEMYKYEPKRSIESITTDERAFQKRKH